MVIDIMVPYWGRVDWLGELIESVLAQDCDQWRLVVVDDCYPGDAARKLVEGLDDERVSYVRNEKNLGLRGNFQRCVELSTAEYLVMPGSDDRFLPHYVSAMLDAVDRHDADIIQPAVRVIDADGHRVEGMTDKIKNRIRPRQLTNGTVMSGQEVAASLMHGNWMYWPSLLLRRSTIVQYPFRDFTIMLDLALTIDVVVHGGSIAFVDEECFEYRRSNYSVSGSTAIDGQRFEDERRYFQLAHNLFKERGWTKAMRAARWHVTSRIHAATLLPGTVLRRDGQSCKFLLNHLWM